jgi:hypothetical protein
MVSSNFCEYLVSTGIVPAIYELLGEENPLHHPITRKSEMGELIQQNSTRLHSDRWNHTLFECCSPVDIGKSQQTFFLPSIIYPANLRLLGLLGCCCPCLLFGKTQAREKGDPDLSMFNSSVRSPLHVSNIQLISVAVLWLVLPRSIRSLGLKDSTRGIQKAV